MIIVFKPQATDEQIQSVVQRLTELGMTPHLSKGVARTLLGAIGDEKILNAHPIGAMPGIERVIPVMKPYRFASREFKQENTVVDLGDGVTIGGSRFEVIAGPCAVESREQTLEIAEIVKSHGVRLLRGGAFKPRTSPYAFQGLGARGLEILSEARARFGLKVVTEVLDADDAPLVAEHADILQIGARNMANFALLTRVGRLRRPVLLKRGMTSTCQELLLAAEYILKEGNPHVILCERGIRTFEPATRNTFDVSAIPFLKLESHLPIVADPSHATGNAALVPSVSIAAMAAGADALMVEVHNHPDKALCDGPETITPESFNSLMQQVRRLAPALGRTV
ncbi:MAG: 3-deoxy-7-phosphoheptulonate synthase [Candidatus Riflebacteria bacterium]|nr:3-deoxy-7-phosphoheptulonate synthase [Candidatus Riflebacteria bacterium]